jgi:general secretion pathway protein D
VPGLGGLPLVGGLFRSESRSRSKTNLLVFLRPVVVRDDVSAEVLSNGRYREMQGLQTESLKPGTAVVPVPNDQVLPPLPGDNNKAQPVSPPATLKPVPLAPGR